MALTCGYPLLGIGWVSNTAGHSRGGSSPSRTHPYVHAGSPCTWPDSVASAPPAGHLHIRLIDEPAVSRHVRAQASSLDELGSNDTVLGQQPLNVRVGQAVRQVPADRDAITSRGKRKPANTKEARGDVIAPVSLCRDQPTQHCPCRSCWTTTARTSIPKSASGWQSRRTSGSPCTSRRPDAPG